MNPYLLTLIISFGIITSFAVYSVFFASTDIELWGEELE